MAADAAPSHRTRLVVLVAIGAVLVVTAGVLVAVRIVAGTPAGNVGSPSSAPSSLPPSSPQSSSPPSSSGPSGKGALAPGDHTLAVTVGGHSRSLILHVPPTGSETGPRPLVLVFHGALDTAANTQRSTDFDAIADQRGMLVAFLQGYQNTWNEGAGHTPAEVAGVDDVAFTSAALAAIERSASVNRDRIAAVGFSNGALLADLLGCRLAQSISLVVPVAGPLPVSVAASCAPARPVSVLEIHGTADQSIPYDGGPFAGVGGGTTVLSAPAAVAKWARLDGCTSGPTTRSGGSLRLSSYTGCDDGVSVRLRTLVGAGHGWPGDIGATVATALGLPG